jgi:hypothetical protein
MRAGNENNVRCFRKRTGARYFFKQGFGAHTFMRYQSPARLGQRQELLHSVQFMAFGALFHLI